MEKQIFFSLSLCKKLSYVILMVLLCSHYACQSPPEQPVLLPAGPEITIYPGNQEVIHAKAQGATKYNWTLQGDGKISTEPTPDIIYTAPKEGGGMAILSVIAIRGEKSSIPTTLT